MSGAPGGAGSALSTRALSKSFGSLAVAAGIDFELPRGARQALIGPNGAGKTTLINMMTGMLAPDSGQIFLGDEDITALKPAARVKRGLARTFQINTLFAHLSALESVALAVCEREGCSGSWWKSLPSYRNAVDEAYGLLESVHLGDLCHRLTRELAYGQQRLLEISLALAAKPSVLLLDEPAAGVPRGESSALYAAISGLSQDMTVLFIEHDMDLVFTFASRIVVMAGGSVLVEGPPAQIATDARVREVYLGSGLHG
jgi:branched-chain amino acid transport system ATP-binding protein